MILTDRVILQAHDTRTGGLDWKVPTDHAIRLYRIVEQSGEGMPPTTPEPPSRVGEPSARDGSSGPAEERVEQPRAESRSTAEVTGEALTRTTTGPAFDLRV